MKTGIDTALSKPHSQSIVNKTGPHSSGITSDLTTVFVVFMVVFMVVTSAVGLARLGGLHCGA